MHARRNICKAGDTAGTVAGIYEKRCDNGVALKEMHLPASSGEQKGIGTQTSCGIHHNRCPAQARGVLELGGTYDKLAPQVRRLYAFCQIREISPEHKPGPSERKTRVIPPQYQLVGKRRRICSIHAENAQLSSKLLAAAPHAGCSSNNRSNARGCWGMRRLLSKRLLRGNYPQSICCTQVQ